jgi:hypothetical protein
MSVENLAGPPKAVSFHYKVDDLFNIDSLWSMYKTVHKLDAEGESLLDKYAITEDERDIFLSFLSDGVYDVFNRFLKYTSGITDAIGFNADYTPEGGSVGKYVWVKISDYETYNVNYLKAVDKVLEKALRFFVLREWFALKDLNDDAAKADLSYKQNIANLLRHSMQLKKTTIVY